MAAAAVARSMASRSDLPAASSALALVRVRVRVRVGVRGGVGVRARARVRARFGWFSDWCSHLRSRLGLVSSAVHEQCLVVLPALPVHRAPVFGRVWPLQPPPLTLTLTLTLT